MPCVYPCWIVWENSLFLRLSRVFRTSICVSMIIGPAHLSTVFTLFDRRLLNASVIDKSTQRFPTDAVTIRHLCMRIRFLSLSRRLFLSCKNSLTIEIRQHRQSSTTMRKLLIHT